MQILLILSINGKRAYHMSHLLLVDMSCSHDLNLAKQLKLKLLFKMDYCVK